MDVNVLLDQLSASRSSQCNWGVEVSAIRAFSLAIAAQPDEPTMALQPDTHANENIVIREDRPKRNVDTRSSKVMLALSSSSSESSNSARSRHSNRKTRTFPNSNIGLRTITIRVDQLRSLIAQGKRGVRTAAPVRVSPVISDSKNRGPRRTNAVSPQYAYRHTVIIFAAHLQSCDREKRMQQSGTGRI